MGMIGRLRQEMKYRHQKEWTHKDVGAFWDSVEDYDEINRQAYSYFQRFTKSLEMCGFPDRAYILDICSRSGNGTRYFFEKNKVRSAVCADVAPNMLKMCSRRLESCGVEVTTVLYDALPLPFGEGQFEAILCFETIEHMPDPGRFLNELSRILHKDGEMILTTPNKLWEPLHSLAAVLALHHSEGPSCFIRRGRLLQMIARAGLIVHKERSSVLLPFNNRWSIKLNNIFERILPQAVLRFLALRRIFILHKARADREADCFD